ncbi:hypothetical protein CYMTET_13498 [Cymbomonas tetramitiformis]|uniref:catechol O-methyltransferase n=1 Tax=Cymbomonas tetramitiformis TaxID=36881 RepID=A0AAE0GJI0_9CHLO|nr:hypothetical protein CYMTET_13498 [Cymbomonas tetramitiformis]
MQLLTVINLLVPVVIAGFVALARQGFTTEWPLTSKLNVLNTMGPQIYPLEVGILRYVLENAKQGDASSVINTFDDYCWKHPVMSVGDVKGSIIDNVTAAVKPTVAVELGSYVGYSTIRCARLLTEGAVVHAVDPNPLAYAVSTSLASIAGVSDKIEFHFKYSYQLLEELAKEGVSVDFLLLDHVKTLYRLARGICDFAPAGWQDSRAPFQGTSDLLGVRFKANTDPSDSITDFDAALKSARRKNTLDADEAGTHLAFSAAAMADKGSMAQLADLTAIIFDVKKQPKTLTDKVDNKGFTPRNDKGKIGHGGGGSGVWFAAKDPPAGENWSQKHTRKRVAVHKG